LSLIKIKQMQRGYATIGVDMGVTDWKSVAAGLGFLAREAGSEEGMRACLLETANHPGPVLIAAKVDPQVYQAAILALRG
jgi:thiamine pyrophosphate-dependent acetolactate synthase large subunit-like protein